MFRFWAAIVCCFALVLPAGSGLARGASDVSDRAAQVARAEAEARKAFADNHYYFITRQGRVDPAEGGIPPFTIGLRRWELFRGNRYVSEGHLYKLLGRDADARRATWHKVLTGALIAAAAGGASASALSVDFTESDPTVNAIGTAGFIVSFGLVIYGQFTYPRKRVPLDSLFLEIQKLNDELRSNIRAQYRLMHGVPLEEPAPRPPAP